MLPKAHRLRSADFKRLRGARVFSSPYFLLRVKEAASTAKAAAVVSAKAGGGAAARNLLRRRIYAVLAGRVRGGEGFFLTITAKGGAEALSFEELQRELSGLLEKGEVLNKSQTPRTKPQTNSKF